MPSRSLCRQGIVVLVAALLLLIPVIPTFSQDPTANQTLESDDPRVFHAGTWSAQSAAPASNGSYLFSSGAEEDALGLSFLGSAIEVIYVAGPQFGTLAIEVDGTVLRTVITTSEKIEYGQVARVNYLSNEPHSLKVYAQAGGIIAVDAFNIIPFETPPAASGETQGVGLDDGGIQSSICPPFPFQRVSLTSAGAQANDFSAFPSLSSTGRFVAFVSEAQLTAADTDSQHDVYALDRQTCQLQLISVNTAGAKGNGISNIPDISGDGRYVAFTSASDNLVAGDTNSAADIFVRDRQTNTTTRVSVATGGAQNDLGAGSVEAPDSHAISADGRYVAFPSQSTNLVAGDTNGQVDIFVHDRQTNTTTRVSVATGGTESDGTSSFPNISADGRYVAFMSIATNLVAGDTNVSNDVFVRDRQTNTTTRVNVATGGAQSDGPSFMAALSADGRYVTFTSFGSNLVAGDTNVAFDVFVHDRQTATTSRVSLGVGGAQANNHSSGSTAISSDGRYVAFDSSATNLVAGDTNALADIFVRDRQANTTTRVSVAMSGTQGDTASVFAAISGDGRTVAFTSEATNLVPGDTNAESDVFVVSMSRSDNLALFNPAFEHVDLLDTLADNPTTNSYTAFSVYAPPTTAGQWVMGDWNGDGLKTPGVYMNGPFYYTNTFGEAQTNEWQSLWIGIAGPPVAGRFSGAGNNDCIGAVQTASLGGTTVFVLYYTCTLNGTPAPTISNQWLSAVLPDSGGFSGTHQFGAGDFNGDGLDSIAVRRGTFIAFGNVAPATGPATFDLAQYIGAPQGGADTGIFVVGDWDASNADSFGLFYQNGELFYRNDLTFNSGVYVNQSVGAPFGNSGVQATTWR